VASCRKRENAPYGHASPRLFEHGAIVKAAALAEMGFDVVGWPHARLAQSHVREAAGQYAKADQAGQPRWLDIEWEGKFHAMPRLRTEARPEVEALSIDLRALFERIGWSVADEKADESLEAPKLKRKKRKAATLAAPMQPGAQRRDPREEAAGFIHKPGARTISIGAVLLSMNDDSLLETVYRAWIATEPEKGETRTPDSFVLQYERMRQIEPSLAEMSDDEIGQLLDLLAEEPEQQYDLPTGKRDRGPVRG
jgi:hypothetical protein